MLLGGSESVAMMMLGLCRMDLEKLAKYHNRTSALIVLERQYQQQETLQQLYRTIRELVDCRSGRRVGARIGAGAAILAPARDRSNPNFPKR